jgi:hypothetical protein
MGERILLRELAQLVISVHMKNGNRDDDDDDDNEVCHE